MAYRIKLESCIGCGVCVDECPRWAIKERNGAYHVELEKCNDCGRCLEVCPVEAVVINKCSAKGGR